MRKLLIVILMLFTHAIAVADTWNSTPKSTLGFVAKVDGSELPGVFKKFDVSLQTSPDDKLTGFKVTINLTAADLGDADTNATLFSTAWFNTEEFAQAVFESTEITQQATQAKVTGTLDLKGTKKTVTFPVEFKVTDDSARLRGSASINRNDFNVGSGEWASADTVGVTVELSFDVEMIRER